MINPVQRHPISRLLDRQEAPLQSLRHKITGLWLRCVNDGVSPDHDLIMAKRIRLYNYLRYASMALLASLALINLGFGLHRAAEVFACAIAILLVSGVVFKLKYTNKKRDIKFV